MSNDQKIARIDRIFKIFRQKKRSDEIHFLKKLEGTNKRRNQAKLQTKTENFQNNFKKIVIFFDQPLRSPQMYK